MQPDDETRQDHTDSARYAVGQALLGAMGELLRKELSGEELLYRIVDAMAQLLEADRGTIFVLDEQRQELYSVAAHLPELPSIRVPLTQGVAGYVARTGRLVNVPYCDEDTRFWREVDQKTGYETVSMLAGPLDDRRGRRLGVVQLLNKRSGFFSREDERNFAALSGQVAELLEMTTLSTGPSFLPETRKRPQEPRVLQQINGLVGDSEAMRRLVHGLLRVARTEATVLLRGESGTGKGVVARALHHNSGRASGPFVHVDCTTLPESLVENELFGHEAGAFTGAVGRKVGKVEAAAGGTLFLDEIGDLPLSLQGKLLTLVQERTYTKVGGSQRVEVDLRILAATNRDLESLVLAGRFREDLYYRLRVVELALPSLRERGEDDLLRLIDHFVAGAARRHGRRVTRLRPDALRMLLEHRWPGNVRELENCIESAVIFADDEISPSDLSLPRANATQTLRAVSATSAAVSVEDEPSLAELERRYIAHLLEKHDGNRSVCAQILGIGRNTLLRKLRGARSEERGTRNEQ